MEREDVLFLQTLPETAVEAAGFGAQLTGHTSYFSIASDCTITVN
jgi:hypothetical protein